MLRFLLVVFFCIANLNAESAKLTKTVGDIIQQKGKIQTGSSSRLELELPYLAIMRIGSNANFKFSSDYREMSLDSGTLMFSSPKDSGGVTIRSGPVIASLTKGDLEMSNVGGNAKVIVLNGKVVASLTSNPNERKNLKYGQMVDVAAGATAMPAVVAIKLSTLLETSALFNMGNFPGARAIRQNATKQTGPIKPFVTGGFDPDWGGGAVSNTLSIGPPGTAAMIARMEANASSRLPPLAPNAIPTQNQIVTFEAAGVPIPKSNIRAIQRSDVVRIIEGRRVEKPQPPIVVQPQPTPQPTRPPVVVQPTPQPTRPPIIRPPIATPRPTIRPPIAPP